MSLPRANYDAHDVQFRVYDRYGKDQLLERLKELHPEQDPYRAATTPLRDRAALGRPVGTDADVATPEAPHARRSTG